GRGQGAADEGANVRLVVDDEDPPGFLGPGYPVSSVYTPGGRACGRRRMSRDRPGPARLPGPNHQRRSLVRRHVRHLGLRHAATRSCVPGRGMARYLTGSAQGRRRLLAEIVLATIKSVKWHIVVRRIVTVLSHNRLQSFAACSLL